MSPDDFENIKLIESIQSDITNLSKSVKEAEQKQNEIKKQ